MDANPEIIAKHISAAKEIAELEAASEAPRKEAARLLESEGHISAAWKGDSADAYLQKLRVISSELDRVQNEILHTIETVRDALDHRSAI